MKLDRALELIERKGCTKRWLAKQCGIEVESLNHILKGRREPGKPVLLLMAHHLDTTQEYLNGEEELDHSQPKQGAAAG